MIWYEPTTLEEIQKWSRHYLMSELNIELTEIGPDYLCATMPVNERCKQPMGFLHGGISCYLAETLGNIAGMFCLDRKEKICVGLELNANHIKSVESGILTARASPLHLGRSTQIWDIQIRNEKNQLIAVSRLTMAVLTMKKDRAHLA